MSAKRSNGSTVLLGAGTGPLNVGGVGVIVRERSRNIISCNFSLHWIGVLVVRLDVSKTLIIVQVTHRHQQRLRKSRGEVHIALQLQPTYTIVKGENSSRARQAKKSLAYCGLGESSERGEWSTMMAKRNKLFPGNTLFKKKAEDRWTWAAPNAKKKLVLD